MTMMKKALAGVTLIAAATLGASQASAADKVTIGYVNGWADSVATANVAAAALEQKLGDEVTLKPVDAAIMWQGVARGDLDVSLAAWLPVTHGQYYKRFKSQIKVLGTNYENAKIGLAVPDYMKTKSVADLKAEKSDYRGIITGIDAGAGVMQKANQANKDYGLGYNVMPSSGTAMTVALGRAIKSEKPIVVTSWLPHWMFTKWHLHFLDDPKGVFGKSEHIDTIANPTFVKNDPKAAALLGKLNWNSQQIGEVMLAISNGEKPAKAASDWVKKNPDVVNQWVAD